MKKHGIERQTLAVAVIPILVLALLMEGYFTYTRFADQDRALSERAKLIVRQLASACEYPVFAGNHGLLQQQVDNAFSQQDVSSVIVLGADSRYLAGAGGDSSMYDRARLKSLSIKAGDPTSFQDDQKVLRLFHPIVATQIKLDELGGGNVDEADSQVLGSVIVEVGKGRLNREKIEVLMLNLILMLLVLLATMLIATRVARRITQPVLDMNNAVRRIGEGHLETYIAGNQVQELDALASGINDMAVQLQQQRDTMEQRVAEATREMREKKEEAEKANFDKTRFLAAASHDLRQPMHALGLFMGELHSRITTPEQREVVGKVEESVEAMSGLLDSLLDISKLDAGVVVPQVRNVDIGAMVRRLAQDYASLAQRKNITLHVRCVEAEVASDPVLLERILLNLLSNAIRYTPQNGTVLLACRSRGRDVRIEVRDNGIGIPEHEQKNIFREFVQLANKARDRSKGLGLGLAIVDRLARLLQHPLGLRSVPGHGSTFTVTAPRVLGVKELLADSALPAEVMAGNDKLAELRVLVIEDDPLVLNGMSGILGSWGCRVSLAGCVQEVQDKQLAASCDLVICDYRLPDGNGLDVAQHVRGVREDAPPFILVSGDTAPQVLQAVNERGLHLLHKPVRPAKLRSLILSLIKRRAAAY